MSTYCAPCLDIWAAKPPPLTPGPAWPIAWAGVRMHVTCGRALHAIATQPRVYEELRSA